MHRCLYGRLLNRGLRRCRLGRLGGGLAELAAWAAGSAPTPARADGARALEATVAPSFRLAALSLTLPLLACATAPSP